MGDPAVAKAWSLCQRQRLGRYLATGEGRSACGLARGHHTPGRTRFPQH